jgi:hypothetical protein
MQVNYYQVKIGLIIGVLERAPSPCCGHAFALKDSAM